MGHSILLPGTSRSSTCCVPTAAPILTKPAPSCWVIPTSAIVLRQNPPSTISCNWKACEFKSLMRSKQIAPSCTTSVRLSVEIAEALNAEIAETQRAAEMRRQHYGGPELRRVARYHFPTKNGFVCGLGQPDSFFW